MFCFSKPKSKEIKYDINIGYNTRERIEGYYNTMHNPYSLESNDWMRWAIDNNHHTIKPGKKGRVEYDPLYHSHSI